MHVPTMAETWQTAIGKDFDGMAQGDLKMGQKGTNSIFVMTHKEKLTHSAKPNGDLCTHHY
jgi:hypothetical protein